VVIGGVRPAVASAAWKLPASLLAPWIDQHRDQPDAWSWPGRRSAAPLIAADLGPNRRRCQSTGFRLSPAKRRNIDLGRGGASPEPSPRKFGHEGFSAGGWSCG